MPAAVKVTGIAVMSGLGLTPEAHAVAMAAGRHGLRPLAALSEAGGAFPGLPAGWVEPRTLFAAGRYGPATNFALALAQRVLEDAALEAEAVREAWLFVGTSRGNIAGWLAPWPGRRGHRQMATSNSMHSEMAAAVSITHGIRGPFQVLSNGCASGLDALGFGYMAVAAGLARRVLVIAADLPLVPVLLESYAQTGLLSRNGVNDPYGPHTTGFLPGEGGAAFLLEPADSPRPAYGYLHGYWANSDAYHPLGLPADGAGIADCLRLALGALPGRITAICPHASGTVAHSKAERRALGDLFHRSPTSISLHLLKPFTGHTIGASGAVDMALLLHHLRAGCLPPNLPGLSGAGEPFTLPERPEAIGEMDLVLKISVGMGGHNAVMAMSRSVPL